MIRPAMTAFINELPHEAVIKEDTVDDKSENSFYYLLLFFFRGMPSTKLRR